MAENNGAFVSELESEYATKKLDAAVPPTAILDTAAAKQKRNQLNHKSDN
jgi:hypothetical protein